MQEIWAVEQKVLAFRGAFATARGSESWKGHSVGVAGDQKANCPLWDTEFPALQLPWAIAGFVIEGGEQIPRN
jgi:hypothetical protein